MADLSGFPYFEMQFTKEGKVYKQEELNALLQGITQTATTDLIVISHGWNTDMDEARGLYRKFFQCFRTLLDSNKVAGVNTRKFAILAVLWPSKKFADKAVTAGGAASIGSPISETAIREKLEDLKKFLDTPEATTAIDQAKQLVPKLEMSKTAQKDFAELLRSVLQPKSANPEDGSTEFFKLPGDEIMKRLSKPLLPLAAPPARSGGATAIGGMPPSQIASPGGAAGVGSPGGAMGAANSFLNFTTYYEMKERAGTVGQLGLNSVLRKIRSQNPTVKIHLMGHSFGARLVTAAAVGTAGQPPVLPNSLSLLQAAFSHYSFAQKYDGTNDGFFRRMITDKMVSGPVLITCSVNDQAVGSAYPVASQLANQVASALGDKNDKYGGLGRNGAQKTPEAINGKLLSVGGTYQFQAGKCYNLNADALIKDHGDICKNEVMYALLKSISLT